MNNPERDWGAIAEAYAKGEESQRLIALRFGIPYSTLTHRALREGWLRPDGTNAAAKRRELVESGSLDPTGRPPITPTTLQARRARILGRLFLALEDRFNRMDSEKARIAKTGETPNPAEQEKQDRTLASLVHLHDKLSEVHDRGQSAARERRESIDDDDADRLRASLAERFARLRRSGEA